MYDTKKKNHTFNTSNCELALIKYYKSIYGNNDVLSNQIIDSRYPYNVDIYIKSIDKFIELQGSWTHGGRPYDLNDEECKKKLTIQQEKVKTSKYYENAIYTWTVRDVEKLNIASKNNVNLERIYCKQTKKKYIYSNGIEIDKNIEV